MSRQRRDSAEPPPELPPWIGDAPPDLTYGHLVRQAIVYTELKNALSRDARVQAYLQSWAAESGLADVLREVETRLAQHKQASPEAVLSDDQIEAILEPFWPAIKESGRAALEGLQRQVMDLVHDQVGIPWGLLVLEVCCCALRDFYGPLLGVEPRSSTIRAVRVDREAPPLTFTFTVQPSESVNATWTRLLEEAEAFKRRLMGSTPMLPRGRIPTDLDRATRDGVAKYARWWYQHHVCGQKKYAIGKAYHADQGHVDRDGKKHPYGTSGCDCRRTVYKGIANVEKLLKPAESSPSRTPDR